MDLKKLIFATLGGFATMFLIGFLWYTKLMKDFYAANAGSATGVGKEEPIISITDGLEVLKVALAAKESAKSSNIIKINKMEFICTS